MGEYTLSLPRDFSLKDTLSCGQCFRWEEDENGSFAGAVQDGSVCHRAVLRQEEGTLFIESSADALFWARYLDLDEDYDRWKEAFAADPTLSAAIDYCGGIRLLRQDPWETLISFIISANNNIPRIKGIIGRLCENFGKDGAFPAAEDLCGLSAEDLAPIRAGFRAKYILDAARKVASGELDLTAAAGMEIEDARQALMQVNGIGPKVAECVLLYGFHRLEAFPVDTWIKKVLAQYYPEGFPDWAEPRGVAQQYLFHYIRNLPSETDNEHK